MQWAFTCNPHQSTFLVSLVLQIHVINSFLCCFLFAYFHSRLLYCCDRSNLPLPSAPSSRQAVVTQMPGRCRHLVHLPHFIFFHSLPPSKGQYCLVVVWFILYWFLVLSICQQDCVKCYGLNVVTNFKLAIDLRPTNRECNWSKSFLNCDMLTCFETRLWQSCFFFWFHWYHPNHFPARIIIIATIPSICQTSLGFSLYPGLSGFITCGQHHPRKLLAGSSFEGYFTRLLSPLFHTRPFFGFFYARLYCPFVVPHPSVAYCFLVVWSTGLHVLSPFFSYHSFSNVVSFFFRAHSSL